MYFSCVILLNCLLLWSCSESSQDEGTDRTAEQVQGKQRSKGSAALVMLRQTEANEQAFSFLVPKGWKVNGGIVRINPLEADGPANAIAAKLDLTIKRDDAGSVMIRWLPDMLYFDARMSPAGQMGLYPPGSNYMGMTVWNLLSAEEYIGDVVFPHTHPNVGDVKVIDSRQLPKLARQYQQRVAAAIPGMTFSYDAAVRVVTYTEGSVRYKEILFALVENWGELGAGMWGNKETIVFRAPEKEFDQWAPIVSIIQNSVKINREWLTGELRGQVQRGEIVNRTMRDIQEIDRQIVEHRQKTMAEINNDMFLTLTNQEEYINPYTKEVEIGTNQYKYRWVNASGESVYSNDEYYNPNQDIAINRTDFKRSAIRPRFPNEQ